MFQHILFVLNILITDLKNPVLSPVNISDRLVFSIIVIPFAHLTKFSVSPPHHLRRGPC